MKKVLLFAAVASAMVLLPAAPSDAGIVFARPLTVTKVVVGPGAEGPYPIVVTCDVTPQTMFDLDDGQTDVLAIQNSESDTCAVAESDTLGGTVTYACEVDVQSNAECVDDHTVAWEGDLTGGATITITNTFQEPTTTTTTTGSTSTTGATTTTAQAAAAAAVTAAVPTFTG
jgi:hypothetical protein